MLAESLESETEIESTKVEVESTTIEDDKDEEINSIYCRLSDP